MTMFRCSSFTPRSLSSFAWIGQCAFSGYTKAGYTSVAPRILDTQNFITFLASGSGVAQAALNVLDVPSGGTVEIVGDLAFTI